MEQTKFQTCNNLKTNRNLNPGNKSSYNVQNKSKFTENNSARQKLSQIPCGNQTILKPIKTLREPAVNATVNNNKLSMISKDNSRKDTILKSNNPIKKCVINKPLIRDTIKSKIPSAKTTNPIRSLSATTSAVTNPLRNPIRNVNLSRQQAIDNSKIETAVPPLLRVTSEMAIQTNENEIMNHSLIVGDLKMMKPSKSLVDDIEKMRQDIKIKKLLKSTRKFQEHSVKDEKHLNDLNEFLEKSYITKKENRGRGVQGDLFEKDYKLINSMDKLLNREIPKTESISDIKARIKRKEQELLSLFDNIPNTRRIEIEN